MRGTFDNDQPKIIFEVKGASGVSRTMEAIIDTGFDGYLQIPITEAFQTGLILVGFQEHTLADGSGLRTLVCSGTVCVEGRSLLVTIDVAYKSNVILLGTKLLKDLGMILTIDCKNGLVELK